MASSRVRTLLAILGILLVLNIRTFLKRPTKKNSGVPNSNTNRQHEMELPRRSMQPGFDSEQHEPIMDLHPYAVLHEDDDGKAVDNQQHKSSETLLPTMKGLLGSKDIAPSKAYQLQDLKLCDTRTPNPQRSATPSWICSDATCSECLPKDAHKHVDEFNSHKSERISQYDHLFSTTKALYPVIVVSFNMLYKNLFINFMCYIDSLERESRNRIIQQLYILPADKESATFLKKFNDLSSPRHVDWLKNLRIPKSGSLEDMYDVNIFLDIPPHLLFYFCLSLKHASVFTIFNSILLHVCEAGMRNQMSFLASPTS
eukprot:m.126889 g.126889  ORF g.126889 m.126889 type:complete len:314 (-) comp17396_c0_seq1:1404-2345(-)